MRDYWYLIAALPALRFGEKPAMGAEQFRTFCSDWLPDAGLRAVESVLDGTPDESGLTAAWHAKETQLRNAVARSRARRYNAESAARPHAGFEVFIEKGVADAFARDNPLEREMELDRLRWSLGDELAAGDSFGFPAVLAYAVKLQIAERWASLNEETGRNKVEELVLSATGAEESELITDNG